MSQTRCELLTLSIDDVNRMQHEFQEPYESLFESAYTLLQKCLKIKLKAMKYCNHNLWKDKLKKIMPVVMTKKTMNSCSSLHDNFSPIEMEIVDEESSIFDSSGEDSQQSEDDFQDDTMNPLNIPKKRKASIFEKDFQRSREQLRELKFSQTMDVETPGKTLGRRESRSAKDDSETIDESKKILDSMKSKLQQKVAAKQVQTRLQTLFAKRQESTTLLPVAVPDEPTNKQIMELILKVQKDQQQRNAEMKEQLQKLENRLN